MRILGLSVVSDLIGMNTNSSAFIYGSMSLLDKVGNGIVILLIQECAPNQGIDPKVKGRYYKNVIFLVCGSFTIGGLFSALFLSVFNETKSEKLGQNDTGKLEGDENKNDSGNMGHEHANIDQ